MKKILLFGMLLLWVTSCIKDNPVKTYSGTEDIYFSPAFSGGDDSLAFSFAFYPDKTDSVLTVPVRATGKAVNTDRKYNLQLTSSTTAEEGKDFDYLDGAFTIPAGELRDNIQLQVHKTEVLKQDTLIIAFELKPNDNFNTNVKYHQTNSGSDSVSVLQYKVFVNNVISEPPTWDFSYMGQFTAKKIYLVSDVTGVEISRWGLPFSDPDVLDFRKQDYLGTLTQRYLDKQAAKGDTVFNDDGSIMRMGYYAQ